MPQGFLVNLGLMAGVVAFALLVGISSTVALATAGGLVLCASSFRRLEDFPRLGLLAIVGLVPLSFLSTRVSVGALDSFTKLIFLPAFGILLVDWALTRRPLALGRMSFFALLFGLVLVLSYLLNDQTPYARWFLFRFIGMLLLFFLCASALRSDRDLKLLLGVIVVTCLVSAIGAVTAPPPAQANGMMGGIVRMTGWSVEDAPTFGTNLLAALLICLYTLVVTHQSWLRLALIPAIGALLVAIILTYARGISVVTVAAVAFLLFRIRKRISPGWVLATVVLLVCCLLTLAPDAYWERMTTMFTQYSTDPTINRRWDSYRIGLRLFEQRPFLGFGPGNFIMQYMSPEFRFERSGVPSVLFNLYLSVANQFGLIGLCAFGMLIWGAFHELRAVTRSYGEADDPLKQTAEILEVVLVALLLISFFEPTDLQKYLWVVFGAAAAAGHIRRKQIADEQADPAVGA